MLRLKQRSVTTVTVQVWSIATALSVKVKATASVTSAWARRWCAVTTVVVKARFSAPIVVVKVACRSRIIGVSVNGVAAREHPNARSVRQPVRLSVGSAKVLANMFATSVTETKSTNGSVMFAAVQVK